VVDLKRPTERHLDGIQASGAMLPAVSCMPCLLSPDQAGALNGKGGGKAQRGNISLSLWERSHRRKAPARKASTKAR
jgi:hypothetical protein